MNVGGVDGGGEELSAFRPLHARAAYSDDASHVRDRASMMMQA